MSASPTDPAPAPPPALRFSNVVVRGTLSTAALVTPQIPRDLPDLARLLFNTLAPEAARPVTLVDGLTLDLRAGECTALVGETGSGKSSIARICARLRGVDDGKIEVDGIDIVKTPRKKRVEVRRKLQVIFDDPEASLDPRHTVRDAFAVADAALELNAGEEGYLKALMRVGLTAFVLDQRAGDLTPGVRRRAGLGRALLSSPAAIVVDEPVHGLDPSERASMLETLGSLRGGPALLVLTQALDVAKALADVIGVLHLGVVVELGGAARVSSAPLHPYARALFAAVPRSALQHEPLSGELPAVDERPPGCAFHPRCKDAVAKCSKDIPILKQGSRDREVACHVVHGDS